MQPPEAPSRYRRRRSAIAGLLRPRRLGAPYVGVISGLGVVIATFLPWYALNIGPPFSVASVSGWESTNLAKAALALGILTTLAAGVLAIEATGSLTLTRERGVALAWAVIGTAAVAAVLIGYRLLRLPEPAEFFSRQAGLYLAMLAAIGGIFSGLALLATRE